MSEAFVTDISGRTDSGVIVDLGGRARLHGFTAEARGGNAHVRIRDGGVAGAPLLCLNLIDGQCAGDFWSDGVVCSTGVLFLEQVDAGGQFLIGSVFHNVRNI